MSTPTLPSQQNCAWVEECIEICDGPSVYVEDEGVRATFINPRRKEVRKVHYDGCYSATDVKQADFIVGLPKVIDVIIELKRSDTNLKKAALQVEETLDAWRQDPKSAPTIAGLIIYGRIEGKKRLPGRVPRASAVIFGLAAKFLKTHKTLLRIHENGERQFSFNNFLR
jgi:hypothetical protein